MLGRKGGGEEGREGGEEGRGEEGREGGEEGREGREAGEETVYNIQQKFSVGLLAMRKGGGSSHDNHTVRHCSTSTSRYKYSYQIERVTGK